MVAYFLFLGGTFFHRAFLRINYMMAYKKLTYKGIDDMKQ